MEKINSSITDTHAETIFNSIRNDIWDDVELVDEDDTSVVYQYECPNEKSAKVGCKKLEKHPVSLGINDITYTCVQNENVIVVTFTQKQS